jgi:hypothetical protein
MIKDPLSNSLGVVRRDPGKCPMRSGPLTGPGPVRRLAFRHSERTISDIYRAVYPPSTGRATPVT